MHVINAYVCDMEQQCNQVLSSYVCAMTQHSNADTSFLVFVA